MVTAKTVEIRDVSDVSCAGTVQDSQALIKMRERLQKENHIADVRMQSLIGKRFAFTFRWTEGGNREN